MTKSPPSSLPPPRSKLGPLTPETFDGDLPFADPAEKAKDPLVEEALQQIDKSKPK